MATISSAVQGPAPAHLSELVVRAVGAAWYAWPAANGKLQSSAALDDLLGYAPDGWCREDGWARIHRDDEATHRAELAAFLDSGAERAEFVYRARTAAGSYRWLRDQVTAERDATGAVARLVGAVSDVTEAAGQEARNRLLAARQAASDEVLRAVSASFDDPLPVFELIARRARELCGAASVALMEYDGTLLHLRVIEGASEADTAALRGSYPRPPLMSNIAGRSVLTGERCHFRDVAAEPSLSEVTRGMGFPSALGVPLRRAGRTLGAVVLARVEGGGFDDDEIALVQSFAEQAVIAITSATTLRELRARNSEYGERIEHQSATIDVLRAMSASPGDTQPVFDLIVRRAKELCNGMAVGLFEYDGKLVHQRSSFGGMPDAYKTFETLFPMVPTRQSIACRAILDGQIVHIRDLDAEPGLLQAVRDLGARTTISVPLMRDGTVIGAISMNAKEKGGFSDSQVALLQTFAEQAVIAITSAETYRALQERTAALALRNSEYGERIEHQAATIDVLKAMSASPDDTGPVFDLIARRAQELCNSNAAAIYEYDGKSVHIGSVVGNVDPVASREFMAEFPMSPTRGSIPCRAILDRTTVHVRDMEDDSDLLPSVRALRVKGVLAIPLLRDDATLGAIAINTTKPGGFTDSQVALLQTFAEQAVIAITSAETYRALQERTAALALRNSEYGERIEQQAATIEILEAISTSAGDDGPVLELITRRARELCDAETAGMFSFDGEMISIRCTDTVDPVGLQGFLKTFPRAPTRDFSIGRAVLDRQIIEIDDADADPNLAEVVHAHRNRCIMTLPFLLGERVVGGMSIAVRKPAGLTESQKALARILAEQASIAIGAAATVRQLQDRTAELTQSVAELQALEEVLRAVNSSLDLDTVLATIISRAVQLSDADQGTIYVFDAAEQVFVPKSAYGMTAERIEALRERRIRIGETPLGISAANRKPLHIPDLRQTPEIDGSRELVATGMNALLAVPLLRDETVIGGLVIRRAAIGGFAPTIPTLLQTFAGQCVLAIENAQLFQEAGRARTAAESALADLRRTQDRLVQAEKMASLGQLTAGIAHEIKNPLNFVNNFSDLSRDLLDELRDAVATNHASEIAELTATLKGNLDKIAQHGRRADSIVKNMLLHSRSGPSEYRPIDLNATVEEALNLAYHGARAEIPGFNITMTKQLDPAAGMVELYPQEFIRVMVNLINNGFYATRRRPAEPGFEPTLRVTTRSLGNQVEVRVRDNGTGISDAVLDRIFEPFFTTKPAGEGTGLGLSLSYDIVVKQHGGQLTVASRINDFTEFTIVLPRDMPAAGGRA